MIVRRDVGRYGGGDGGGRVGIKWWCGGGGGSAGIKYAACSHSCI